MTKDEMKNKISMALKDPILQQGFECICKNLAELQEEIAELKTKKIPQLERKIASIRGCHSVDAKKLNARIEQVERLKKENAELKKDKAELCHSINEAGKAYTKLKEENNYLSEQIQKLKIELDTPESVVLDKLDEAKEIIKRLMDIINHDLKCFDTMAGLDIKQKAEQFLKEE